MKKSSLGSSFGYLMIIQLGNIIVPLLYYPFAVDVFGITFYGKLVTVAAICSIITMFVEFGFNITATKTIAESKDNREIISSTISSVYLIKTILLVVITISSLIGFSVFATDDMILFYCGFLSCIGWSYFPQWVFQGLEKIKTISLIVFIFKLITLPLFFIIIKDQDDANLYMIVVNSYIVLASVVSNYILMVKYGFKIIKPTTSNLRSAFSESLPIFISKISLNSVVKSAPIIIGNRFGFEFVTYYDLAEKVVNAMMIPINAVIQVVYPRLVSTKSTTLLRKVITICVPVSIGMSLCSIIMYKTILPFVIDPVVVDSSFSIFLVLVTTVTLTLISNLIGNCGLVISGNVSDFTNSVYFGNFVFVTLVTITVLSPNGTPTWIVISVVINYFVIAMYRINCYVFKRKL